MENYESWDEEECIRHIRAMCELGLDWMASSQIMDGQRFYRVTSSDITFPKVPKASPLKPSEDPLPGSEDDTD